MIPQPFILKQPQPFLLGFLAALLTTQIQANSQNLEILVTNTHQASLQAREKSLRKTVAKDTVTYQSEKTHLHVPLFNVEDLANYTLPKVNGTPIQLRHPKTLQSPYLNSTFGSGEVSVTINDIRRTLDLRD